MEYGSEIKFDVCKLEKEHLKLIQNFKCGNDEIDKYLINKALNDMEFGKSVTKIFINKNINEIIGYYSVNCSSIVMENYEKRYFSPAIEIKMFALDTKYHKMLYEKDNDEKFSEILFSKIIKDIYNITENYCGASHIILYSVPYAIKFYKDIGFEDFEEYMISNDDKYL